MVKGSNAIFQIVERKRFELTGETGEGPSVATLAARTCGRRQDVCEEGLGRKRLSLDRLSAEAAAAGLTSQPTSGRGTVLRTVAASGGSEARAVGDGSTHRFDRERIDVCRGTEKGPVEKSQRLTPGDNSGRLKKEREQWYKQLAYS
jgi:hypothetical protein